MKKKKKAIPFKSRDKDKTKAEILRVATSQFALKGQDGASINEIAELSGSNKRMIYHYFGDKQGLFRAVYLNQWVLFKDWIDRSHEEAVGTEPSHPVDYKKLIFSSVGLFFDYLAERHEFGRLLMWDSLAGGDASNSIWEEVRGPLFTQINSLLEEAQKKGIVKKELDTAHLVISFLGSISFYFTYSSTMNEMIGGDPLSKKALAKRREHIMSLLDCCFE